MGLLNIGTNPITAVASPINFLGANVAKGIGIGANYPTYDPTQVSEGYNNTLNEMGANANRSNADFQNEITHGVGTGNTALTSPDQVQRHATAGGNPALAAQMQAVQNLSQQKYAQDLNTLGRKAGLAAPQLKADAMSKYGQQLSAVASTQNGQEAYALQSYEKQQDARSQALNSLLGGAGQGIGTMAAKGMFNKAGGSQMNGTGDLGGDNWSQNMA